MYAYFNGIKYFAFFNKYNISEYSLCMQTLMCTYFNSIKYFTYIVNIK